MRKFHKYNDAGHGWLRIKISALLQSGIADKISGFSYVNGESVYLEEDCDQWIYLEAIGFKRGEDEIVDHFINGHSHIRGFDSVSSWGVEGLIRLSKGV